MNLVFDSPIHAKGCIFDDPTAFLDESGYSPGVTAYRKRIKDRLASKIHREDDTILTVIMAYMTIK